MPQELTPKQIAAGWTFVPIPVEQVKEWPIENDGVPPTLDAVASLDALENMTDEQVHTFIEGDTESVRTDHGAAAD